MKLQVPQDACVIYPSKEGRGKYVAHSLRTDQIGVGDSLLDAYVELLRALRALYADARNDPRVVTDRLAPDDVWKMLPVARRLPRELEENAIRIVNGRKTSGECRIRSRGREPVLAPAPPELVRA
jgi:hypothetical protein